MKILFLTVTDQQKHSLNNHVDLHCTYDFMSWVAGFQVLDHDIHIFDYYESFVTTGAFHMENEIIRLVKNHDIQLLIVPSIYYEVAPSFLDQLRRIGCKSLFVSFDDTVRFETTNRYYLGAFDYYLTHESSASRALYEGHGFVAEFFPNLPSASFYREMIEGVGRLNIRPFHDIAFVGAKIADREIFINYLEAAGVKVAVYGKGWPLGMLSTQEMLAAFSKARICLNFVKTIDGSGRFQLKGRIFEIVMAGGFVLSEHSDELADYFDIGREIDTFRSPQELVKKIKFYLENDEIRLRMLAKAKQKAETYYSFEAKWTRYLEDIENGVITPAPPNADYKIPSTAINSFINWNRSFMYGRFMIGQYRLALQQYQFYQREMKHLLGKQFVSYLLLKRTIRILVSRSARRLLTQQQISEVKKVYSRNQGVFKGAHRKLGLAAKLGRIRNAYMKDEYAYTDELIEKVFAFISKRKVPGKKFEYFFSENSSKPTLYASTYACMSLSLIGKLNTLSTNSRKEWIEYFDSFQSASDGLFYDPVVDSPLFRSVDWWGARHLALHMISAYTDLGGRPRHPFSFLKDYYDHGRLKKWLDGFNWQVHFGHENDIDNKIMNIGCLLQYQRDAWNDKEAGEAVGLLQEYLMKKINPETGMWGRFDVSNPFERSRMVQFAYHLFPIFLYDRIPINNPDSIVRITLATQNRLGGFGVNWNSSACEDIDSVFILVKLASFVDHKRESINKALKKTLYWVLCNQVEDGGFVFRLNESLEYGHPQTASSGNRSAMMPVWFRTLCLAYLEEYLGFTSEFNITRCAGYEF